MKLVKTKLALDEAISALKELNSSALVGFVPTMGALHSGHIALVEQAARQSEIVVVSIFVNPTQFNSQVDLKNYPRTLDADCELLRATKCDIVFAPNVAEVYPVGFAEIKIDLKGLDEIMEGEFRPGHFQGVITVVNRLFQLVSPDLAFFGKKDFQQVAIIHQMIKEMNSSIKIVEVEIQRNEAGLALSSRNVRLSQQQLLDALIIIETLKLGKKLFESDLTLSEVKLKMLEHFNAGNLELEYLSIVDNETLKTAESKQENLSCCIAAYCGDVRLIDNMCLS